MGWVKCGGGSAAKLISKSITQNGTYNASSDNADGYSSVNVNVGSTSLTLKYQDATIGSTTYTIDSDGIYLIFVVFSLGGSGSITLPSGRTASYAGDFLTTGAAQGDKGTRVVVAFLQEDDVITLSASPAVDRPDHQTWNAFAKIVMKIPFSVTTLLDSRIISDNSVTYEYHTGSGTVLGILTAWSAFLDQSSLFDLSEIGTVDDVIAGRTGVNTLIRVVISDIATLPTLFARGYNGGGVTIAVLQ